MTQDLSMIQTAFISREKRRRNTTFKKGTLGGTPVGRRPRAAKARLGVAGTRSTTRTTARAAMVPLRRTDRGPGVTVDGLTKRKNGPAKPPPTKKRFYVLVSGEKNQHRRFEIGNNCHRKCPKKPPYALEVPFKQKNRGDGGKLCE